MARSSDPDSGGSQFFVWVADTPHLDRQYTAFGKITADQDVVDKISNVERNRQDRPNSDIKMVSVKVNRA